MEFLLKSSFLRRMLTIGAAAVLLFSASPQTHAEPVTMIILAPLALKAANMASPHIIEWMTNSGAQLLTIGKDIMDIFCLPLGIVQCTAGVPFGLFSNGLGNIGAGCVAPFKLVVDVLLLPLAFFGFKLGG
ncbi:MAG: hypothetical protein IKC89_03750 [Lentisphaeria bacterium]|nr:hypothetical protein [Lentisphaeria bacterium]